MKDAVKDAIPPQEQYLASNTKTSTAEDVEVLRRRVTHLQSELAQAEMQLAEAVSRSVTQPAPEVSTHRPTELEATQLTASTNPNSSTANLSPKPKVPESTCPFTAAAIGTLRSVFKERNGTPRQGLHARHCRASLKLSPATCGVDPVESLQGLEAYSHIWVLFMFHANTNGANTRASRSSMTKAKVRPPQLGNRTVGLFATRTPHRPVAIGLSLVQLERIEGSTVHMCGVDLVHGTPILDIKPYHPADIAANATFPDWVACQFPELGSSTVPVVPPLRAVEVREDVRADLRRYVDGSLLEFYRDAEEVERAIVECIVVDMRRDRQRVAGALGPAAAHGFCFDYLNIVFEMRAPGDVAVVVSVEHMPNGIQAYPNRHHQAHKKALEKSGKSGKSDASGAQTGA